MNRNFRHSIPNQFQGNAQQNGPSMVNFRGGNNNNLSASAGSPFSQVDALFSFFSFIQNEEFFFRNFSSKPKNYLDVLSFNVAVYAEE